MTSTMPSTASSPTHAVAGRASVTPGFGPLAFAARAWFVAAAVGQGIFALYVLVFYGGAVVSGHPERWNDVLSRGHVPGDGVGNLVLGLHLLFAVQIIVGGIVQCLPAIRRRWPALHRWNGRLYMLSATTLALGGLYLVWIRSGSAGDAVQHAGVSLDALLILVFAALSWRAARARRFDAHRRWALRLFLVVSGVWFFRIGLMLWILANRGPVGFDPETFSGPALNVIAFAQSLLPLAVLELYFRATAGGAGLRRMATVILWLCVLATFAGIGAATMLLWWPRL